MDDHWYYAKDNATVGPLAFEELRNVVSSSPNPIEVLVWNKKYEDWQVASNVPGLIVQKRKRQSYQDWMFGLFVSGIFGIAMHVSVNARTGSIFRPFDLDKFWIDILVLWILTSPIWFVGRFFKTKSRFSRCVMLVALILVAVKIISGLSPTSTPLLRLPPLPDYLPR